MNLVRFCRENRYAIYLVTAFLFFAGLVSFFLLPSNIYPEVNFPRVLIVVNSGDLAPDVMLVSVIRPLEQAASAVLGFRRVRSKTIRGAAEISVLFRPDMDMQLAQQLVQGRVSEIRSSLPPATVIRVERVTPALFPAVSYILNGDVPSQDLRDYAFYVLKPLFSRVPGTGNVEVQATDTREVSVIVDPQKLLARHLSLVDVADGLRTTNEVNSVGRLQKDYLQYLILSTSQFASLDDIRNTVVATEGQAPVRLSDIAQVLDGVEDRRTLITGNGQPAALINVSRQIGGDLLQIEADLKRTVADLGSAIPRTLHLSVVYDLAEFVRSSVANVRDAILIGGVLAVLILYLFLREGRATLVAAVSLPLSVVCTFFFLRLFNGTLNLMSLGGLAIAIGLIIDDAVVVIENIYRHLGLGDPPAQAAERGTSELLGPVVGSTATTLVVFLPLGLLQGVVGEFFRALCLTLAISVLFSLIFAVTLIPLLAQRFLSAGGRRKSSDRLIEPVYRGYERAVRWAVNHRNPVMAGVAALVLLGGALYWNLRTGFLPEMDEGGYVLDYWTPPGTSLAETDRILREIEARVAGMPETAAFSRRTGAELGLFATEQNRGDVLVKLKPPSQRKRSTQQLIEDLRAQIHAHIPGVQVEFVQILQDMLGDLEGSPEPVEVKIFGPSMPVLEQVAREVGQEIQRIPGIVDFRSVQKGNPEIVLHVDAERAGRAGLTVDQVSQQVSAGLLGVTSTEFRQADRTIGIRARFPDWFRFNAAMIPQFPIVTVGRKVIPLNSLATIEQVKGENQLLRENQRLMVDLTARLENRDLGSAMSDVRGVMRNTRLPVGCTYEIGGQYESQQSSFRQLLGVLALGLAAVFTVLVIQFRAFRPALIIISVAPLSLVGVFGLLELTGTPLNVSSFMGIILMIGLVVKNGIILFQQVHVLWEEQKMPLRDALVAAGRVRVRPILMTTLATLLGLLPLALGLGAGAELQKPLALAVIGGLSISTFLTLFVMPVFYSFVGDH